MACLLAVGFLAMAPAANAAPAGYSFAKAGESARNGESVSNGATEIKHRRRGRRGKRLQLPIVPYSAYDYPYYYKRGYFPTHIGPGYMYYGYPYFYRMRYSDRCSYRHQRCVAKKRGACICR
jgi:hypothetical protein